MDENIKSQIEKIRRDCEVIKPLVVIRCITYNHKDYIKDALDGFVNQKTSFPYVAIVHDDASTDGTVEIIQEYALKYPEIIKPIFEKENQYSKRDGSLSRIIRSATECLNAVYFADCEGDDYWIDPDKLQKQVDFLDANPDYSMCYTKVKRFEVATKSFKDEWGGDHQLLSEFLKMNTVPTLTSMLRVQTVVNYHSEIHPDKQKWMMGDYPLWLYIAATSKIKFLPMITGVYRILNESASHSTDQKKVIEFNYSFFTIATFFAKRYNSPQFPIIEETKHWFEFKLRVYEFRVGFRETIGFIKKVKKRKYKFYAAICYLLPHKILRKYLTKS